MSECLGGKAIKATIILGHDPVISRSIGTSIDDLQKFIGIKPNRSEQSHRISF
jgi:hypothetical protein